MIEGTGLVRKRASQITSGAFPGRWNPRRAIPADIEPLASAVALALEDAGWWVPGSGRSVAGALVVGVDRGSHLPALRFAREVQERASPGPSDFLFSLPSSAAGVLGILFGLTDYQATVVGESRAGLQALRHALDLLRLGRQENIVVAVLSVGEKDLLHEFQKLEDPDVSPEGPCERPCERIAVAWCLSAPGGSSRYPVEVECAIESRPRQADSLMAVTPFLEATEWLRSGPSLEAVEGVLKVETGWGSILLTRKGSSGCQKAII
jgi:hypothetical protein